MKITQTLRKPANWQDFESLCLLLWREEWRSEDLKKNGRNGQAQKGVDICGHRDDEDEYSGIQCKCKLDKSVLTQDEIDAEIENAKTFRPELRRLVFATTADKDASIEEYVRIKDHESRKNGNFSIDIKSWQDIVDMLERNKSVLNTYLDVVEEDFAVAITFENGCDETIIRPKFLSTHYMAPLAMDDPPTVLSKKEDVMFQAAFGGLASQLQHIWEFADLYRPAEIVKAKIVRGHIATNYSYCPMKFRIINQGRSPIDDYKVIFNFGNEHVNFKFSNVEKDMVMPEISFSHALSNVTIEEGVGVTMYGNSLIPGDSTTSDVFFIHTPIGTQELFVTWKLLSRYYSAKGSLKIVVKEEMYDELKYSEDMAGETALNDYVEVNEITD